MPEPRRAIDAFSGAGGLSLGLAGAGLAVAVAFDNNLYAVETYRTNFRHPILHADARKLSAADLLRAGGITREDVLLLAGGPPCQGFSVQRRGEDRDDRNDLIFEFLRLILELRPPFFLMENVPGLKNRRGEAYLAEFIDRVRRSGYVVHEATLNAADYGVPQIRKRLFVVGELAEALGAFRFPRPSHSDETSVTVGMALKDLPSPPADYSPHPAIANHQKSRMSELNLLRIWHVPQGGGWEHIPQELRVPCHEPGAAKIGHRYVYGRLDWEKPAATITAKFDSFTRGKFAHPLEDRSVTLREGARLQSFADDFVFRGPKEEIAAQIGNAVPPLLARALGTAILEAYAARNGRRVLESSGQIALF
jgi:DNA (cytosine-5)-methyltransferase 1